MGGKIYTTDVGTRIRTTLTGDDPDLTGYSTVKYKVKYSDDSEQSLTCVVEDVDDGIVYYVKTAADFHIAGEAKVQVEVDFGTEVFLGSTFIVPLFAPYD